MANEHPFHLLFESFGRLPVAHAEAVNREAHDSLAEILDVPVEGAGRCILLRAPRAGHGKTHLLSRIQHQLGGTHEFVPLHAMGSRIDAMSVTEDVLKRLVRSLPAAGGLTVLDLVVRRLFSFALQPLVVSGEVPCQDRDGALAALKSRPVETFDFHHPNAVTAHWAKENFEVLGPRLSLELAQSTGAPIREVSFWVSALFRYASTALEHPGRSGVLGVEVAGEPFSENGAMERLIALLSLLSLLMRVVLVADDLEGFSADESAALKLAAFVGAIRQSAERVDVILSLNQDVWENAFLPRLSGGLADRLSEVVIELQPLSQDEVVALFESRVPGLGKQIADRVKVGETHARGLIRLAGTVWLKEEGSLTAEPSSNVIFGDEGIFGSAAAAEISSPSQFSAVELAPAPPLEPAKAEEGFSAAASGPLPEPDFPVTSWETPAVQEPTTSWETPAVQEPATSWETPAAQEPATTWQPVSSWEPIASATFNAPATPEFAPEPSHFSAEPIRLVPEPSHFAPEPPRLVPEPSYFAPPSAPAVGTPEGYEPAVLIEPGPQWGRSVFEAVVTDQPPSRPFSDPIFSAEPVASFVQESAASAFIPVTEPVSSGFSSAAESALPPGWQFQAVVETPQPPSAPSDFGPPKFSPPPETAPASDDDTHRVDDLLKQFRERYGRGSL